MADNKEFDPGIWADDHRAVEGLAARRKLAAYEGRDVQGHQSAPVREFDAYDDPRALAERAAREDARTWDSYRQTGAWRMQSSQSEE